MGEQWLKSPTSCPPSHVRKARIEHTTRCTRFAKSVRHVYHWGSVTTWTVGQFADPDEVGRERREIGFFDVTVADKVCYRLRGGGVTWVLGLGLPRLHSSI